MRYYRVHSSLWPEVLGAQVAHERSQNVRTVFKMNVWNVHKRFVANVYYTLKWPPTLTFTQRLFERLRFMLYEHYMNIKINALWTKNKGHSWHINVLRTFIQCSKFTLLTFMANVHRSLIWPIFLHLLNIWFYILYITNFECCENV